MLMHLLNFEVVAKTPLEFFLLANLLHKLCIPAKLVLPVSVLSKLMEWSRETRVSFKKTNSYPLICNPWIDGKNKEEKQGLTR